MPPWAAPIAGQAATRYRRRTRRPRAETDRLQPFPAGDCQAFSNSWREGGNRYANPPIIDKNIAPVNKNTLALRYSGNVL
jgi:hypothetical protein